MALLQHEDIRGMGNQTVGKEGIDMLRTEALDVEGVARHEMLQSLGGLRRTNQPAGTPARRRFRTRRINLAFGVASAGRTGDRETKRLGIERSLLDNNPHHLRNDVTCPLHDNSVTDTDILAGNLILVVQRRVGDHHTSNRHRPQLGHRRQRTGTTHLDVDAQKLGLRLLGWKLVGDGPARRTADETQSLLEIQPVHLVDNPIDVIANGRALPGNARIIGKDGLHRLAARHERIGREPPRGKSRNDVRLRRTRQGRRLAPGIG